MEAYKISDKLSSLCETLLATFREKWRLYHISVDQINQTVLNCEIMKAGISALVLFTIQSVFFPLLSNAQGKLIFIQI